jgi:hypothetical protein
VAATFFYISSKSETLGSRVYEQHHKELHHQRVEERILSQSQCVIKKCPRVRTQSAGSVRGKKRVGAIGAGGTKFVCAVGTDPANLAITQLPHPAWTLEARYLALGLANWVCTLSPKRIVLGGGVMQGHWIIPLIRRELVPLLNGYVQSRELTENLDQYVVPAKLG